MTLDEAIQHAREIALSNTACSVAYRKGGQTMLADSCDARAAEQTQIADWLEELQQRRGRATELAALESLRKQINETGQVRGISGTIVQSVRPCVASGVRAAIQTLIDLTNKEIITREEGGADNDN